MKLLCALPLMLLASGAPDLPTDFQLEFSRGPCMGSCRVYTITVDHDGLANYAGRQFTKVGYNSHRLSRGEMKKLLSAIEEFDFFHSPFHISPESMDGSSDTVTIRMNGQEQTVATYGGYNEVFERFEKRLDELTGPRNDAGLVDPEQAFTYSLLVNERISGPDLAIPSIRLARQSLLLLVTTDTDRGTLFNSKVQVDRNGDVRLQTDRLLFVDELQARLSRKRIDDLQRSLPALRRVKSVDSERPTEKLAMFCIPRRGRLREIIGSPLGAIPDGAMLEQLADDRTYAREAGSVRLEIVPGDEASVPVRPWPAEDLVPTADLAKRTLTPGEWQAIASRLERHDLKEWDYLDGRPFGSKSPVRLRVIMLPK